MALFHRLTAPGSNYVLGGAGPLPADYDYINNDPADPAGTAALSPAYVNTGPKASGYNEGTYFLAWRDEAVSANVNRVAAALADNDDYLDNILRRRMATPKVVEVTVNSGDTSIVLSDWVWTGTDVAANPLRLVAILDDNATFVESTFVSGGVRSILGPTDIRNNANLATVVGTGWVENPRISINDPEATKTIYVVYGVRDSLTTAHAGALHERQTFANVNFEMIDMYDRLKGGSASADWHDAGVTTLYDTGWSGLQEAYGRATTRDISAPAYHPAAQTLNTPGAGSWFTKPYNGPGMWGFSGITGDLATEGSVGLTEHGLGALWGAALTDDTFPTSANERLAVSSGFVVLGGRAVGFDDTSTGKQPGLFGFYHGSRNPSQITGGAPDDRTVIANGDVATVSGATLTLPVTSRFYTDLGGDKSAFALGYDIIRFTAEDGFVHTVTITAFTDEVTGTMRYLDGSTPSFSAQDATLIEWIQTEFFTSEDAPAHHNQLWGATNNVKLNGFFYSAGVAINASTSETSGTACTAKFSGRSNTSFDRVLEWGGYDQTTFTHAMTSWLTGNGGAVFTGTVINQGAVLMTGGTNISAASYVSSASGKLTTDTGGRFELGDNDYPLLAVGHTGRSRGVIRPLTDFAAVTTDSTVSWTLVEDADYGHTGWKDDGVEGRLVVDLGSGLHNGATLSSVDIFWKTAVHGSMPAVRMSARIMRSYVAEGDAVASNLDLYTGGFLFHTTGNITSYSNKYQKLTFVCDTLNVIDTTQYRYALIIVNESGANSAANSVFTHVKFNYTSITDMRFQ
jgi:hypothetical protein